MGEGRLYVCATPIGNLSDVSDRLRQVLAGVDVVYAEDTRRAAKLLNHIGVVDIKVRSLFTGNEKSRSEELIERLRSGDDVAVITDAGTPAVSDPGAWVTSLAHAEGLSVTVIPGPSAVTTALALSGFPADRFTFEGFLPRKGSERARRLATMADDDRTMVVFASPHRLPDDLAAMAEVFGPDRVVAVARELTKLHEEVWIGPLGEAIDRWAEGTRGEVTVVISPAEQVTPGLDEALVRARELVIRGETVSEAARRVAEEMGVSRRQVYQALLDS